MSLSSNMSAENVLHLDILISEKQFKEGALKILEHARPQWDSDNIQFKVFTEGITNKMMGCYHNNDFKDVVLVRINGEGTDIIIDRKSELETFSVLGAADCAPPVYCTFRNGMAYGFYPGLPLDEKSVREPIIQKLIAQEMARLHSVQGPASRRHQGGKVPSRYKERVLAYIKAGPTHFDDPEKQDKFAKTIPSKEELVEELDELVDTLEALDMETVFSHNDLLLKNIIYDENQGVIRFIDYEYAFYNYEAFDIGNHFDEYAGMDEVNYDLYPARDEQLRWLRHYLVGKAQLQGKEAESVSDLDIERLYVQTNKCACAGHFFWGVWALIQAEHSSIDFDYVGYSHIRLSEYFRRKKEYFPLTVPSSA